MNSRVILTGLLWLAGSALAQEKSAYERGVELYASGDMFGAIEAVKPAADQGDAKSMALLGYILDKAEENEQALVYYRRAAELNEPLALFRLGGMYSEGDGVEQDLETARELIEKAAELGQIDAIQVIGSAYELGQLGLTADLDKAIEWFRRGAEAGDESSINDLKRLEARKSASSPAAE